MGGTPVYQQEITRICQEANDHKNVHKLQPFPLTLRVHLMEYEEEKKKKRVTYNTPKLIFKNSIFTK